MNVCHRPCKINVKNESCDEWSLLRRTVSDGSGNMFSIRLQNTITAFFVLSGNDVKADKDTFYIE